MSVDTLKHVRSAAVGAIGMGALCGCGAPATHLPPPSNLPARVDISIKNATIGIKSNGEEWDGHGRVSKEAMEQITKLAKLPTLQAVALGTAGALVGALASIKDPPDAQGTAKILGCSTPVEAFELAQKDDTFTPSWEQVTWHGVPFERTMRVEVSLVDSDRDGLVGVLGGEDGIGTAQMTYDDLVDALVVGKVLQVNVADQTNNQLLFVGISVMPSVPDAGEAQE